MFWIQHHIVEVILQRPRAVSPLCLCLPVFVSFCLLSKTNTETLQTQQSRLCCLYFIKNANRTISPPASQGHPVKTHKTYTVLTFSPTCLVVNVKLYGHILTVSHIFLSEGMRCCRFEKLAVDVKGRASGCRRKRKGQSVFKWLFVHSGR